MADWSDHEWKLLIGGELVDGANGNVPDRQPRHRRGRRPTRPRRRSTQARRRPRRAGGVPGVVADAGAGARRAAAARPPTCS